MKSATATRILFDDPNSFFRASRTVALHEQQGSTLRTKKPLISDIKSELASSSVIISLLNNLDAIDTRLIWIRDSFALPPIEIPFHITEYSQRLQEVIKYIGLAKGDCARLKKSTAQMSEDDIQAVYDKFNSIITQFNDIMNVDIADENEFGEMVPNANADIVDRAIFKKFEADLRSLIGIIDQLLKLKNQFVAEGPSTGIPAAEVIPPPPDYDPEEEVGAGRYRGGLLGAPSGHFRVLSSRAREIQAKPYKRFA